MPPVDIGCAAFDSQVLVLLLNRSQTQYRACRCPSRLTKCGIGIRRSWIFDTRAVGVRKMIIKTNAWGIAHPPKWTAASVHSTPRESFAAKSLRIFV